VKLFFKTFVAGLLMFLLLLVPLEWGLTYAGNMRIFSGTENLEQDMPELSAPPPQEEYADPLTKAFHEANRVNVLMLGVNDGLTDTIMLGSYDLDAGHIDVVSVPRDTYYDRADARSTAAKKINSIYSGKKAVGTAIAVSDVLQGMPIHYYVVVDYQAVKKVVNSMGGVPMDIPFHMVYNDPYDKPPLKIDIPAGQQVLNGDKAVEFLRFRKGASGYKGYPEGDIGRVKAQQQFVKSAFRQAIGLNLPKVVTTTLESVDSDISLGVAAKLAAKAAGLTGEDVQTITIPGNGGMKGGLSFWLPDEEAIKEMLMQIYGVQPEPEETEVEAKPEGDEPTA
jgi:LCP family protein required for cell wall assembly